MAPMNSHHPKPHCLVRNFKKISRKVSVPCPKHFPSQGKGALSLPSARHSRGQKDSLEGPSYQLRGQAGQELYPVQYTASQTREGEHSQWKRPQAFQSQRPLFHEPRTKPENASEAVSKKWFRNKEGYGVGLPKRTPR